MHRVPRTRTRRKLIAGVLLILALNTWGAWTAVNVVPTTYADMDEIPLDPNQLKPPECAGITVNQVLVANSVLFTGTPGNDLILGTPQNAIPWSQSIDGAGGDDCIVAARQILFNTLSGGEGDDVLIGHPSTVDICVGGPGNDLLYNCDLSLSP